MQKRLVYFSVTFIVLIFKFGLLCAYAELIDNHDGTITQYRIDGSGLMWLKDANYAISSGESINGFMTWEEAIKWVAHLNNIRFLEYDDWRLPVVKPLKGKNYNIKVSFEGNTDLGWNIDSCYHELSYLYYVELRNVGYASREGSFPEDGYGLKNIGPFINLDSYEYWESSEYNLLNGRKFYFDFINGREDYHNSDQQFLVWPVRDCK